MIPRLFTNMLPFAITVAIISVPVLAGGTYFPQHYFTGHRPVIRTHSYSSSRSRRSHMGWCQEEISVTELASRSRRVDTSIRSEERNEKKADPVDDLTDVSYNDLGPIGKTVAGCTEIVFATFFDYCSGYLQGLLFGTMFGSPGFVFRPIEKGVHQPFVSEMSRRFTRMNTRSMSWAKNFGSISAAFGGVSIFLFTTLTFGHRMFCFVF